jgi:urate oxidase
MKPNNTTLKLKGQVCTYIQVRKKKLHHIKFKDETKQHEMAEPDVLAFLYWHLLGQYSC